MSDDVQALTRMVVAIGWMKARIKATDDAARARLEKALQVTERKPAYIDGVLVGAVTLAKPSGTPTVTDPAAFLAWVKANHPEGIEETVSPLFKASILAATKLAEAPMSHYGEADIPGVEYVIGQPTLQVRPVHGDEASAAMFAALREANAITPLLALPPVDGDQT